MLSTTTISGIITWGKNCTVKLKSFGTLCWVYVKLLPELYNSLAWCTKCILIILKSGILICRDSYEILVKLHFTSAQTTWKFYEWCRTILYSLLAQHVNWLLESFSVLFNRRLFDKQGGRHDCRQAFRYNFSAY